MYNFTKDLPKYGDLYEINRWKSLVKCGGFTDYDGEGNWVKDGKMTDDYYNNVCDLGSIETAIKEGITHVMWFNK